ncbi:MAG: hypothetical protein QOG86_1363, partial [Thermoleophilaceae bacterium]|nr:hypothetical protein [Thermoleophilaceae bacterium]
TAYYLVHSKEAHGVGANGGGGTFG